MHILGLPYRVTKKIFDYLTHSDLQNCREAYCSWRMYVQLYDAETSFGMQPYLLPQLKETFDNPYYWGDLNIEDATEILKGCRIGTFILHNLKGSLDKYCMTASYVYYTGQILRKRILQIRDDFEFDFLENKLHHTIDMKNLCKDHGTTCYFSYHLTFPKHRPYPFSLQELSLMTIGNNCSRHNLNKLPIPQILLNRLSNFTTNVRPKLNCYYCNSVDQPLINPITNDIIYSTLY